MGKKKEFSQEQVAEVKALRKKIKEASLSRKLQAVELKMEGYSNNEIVKITGYCVRQINGLVSVYLRDGLDYFRREQRAGGNRRNMSLSQEAEMLSAFEQAGEAGQVITVAEIKAAYEEKCGHRIGRGQIYRVLARHGWRKVMPRSQHPNKADDGAIEASKKLTPGWRKK